MVTTVVWIHLNTVCHHFRKNSDRIEVYPSAGLYPNILLFIKLFGYFLVFLYRYNIRIQERGLILYLPDIIIFILNFKRLQLSFIN
jgi:hypothetical protein